MNNYILIRVHRETAETLKALKSIEEETYNTTINRLIKNYLEGEKNE